MRVKLPSLTPGLEETGSEATEGGIKTITITKTKTKTKTLAHFVPLRQGRRARSAEGVDKIANLLMAHRSVLSTPLSCRGAGGESVQSYT